MKKGGWKFLRMCHFFIVRYRRVTHTNELYNTEHGFSLTIVSGNIASPKDAHNLPVSYAHKEQRPGIQENQLDDREGSLTLLTPGPDALSEQNSLHPTVRRDYVQHQQFWNVWRNKMIKITPRSGIYSPVRIPTREKESAR